MFHKNVDDQEIILLDLCSINTIKNGISGNFKGDKTKEDNFNTLVRIISSKKFRFSFYLAIIERCSYPIDKKSKNELIEQFHNDYKDLSKIINKKNIYEPFDGIRKMIDILLDDDYFFNERLEQAFHLGVELINYFQSIVDKGGIKREHRKNLIEQLFEKADELNLCKTFDLIFITCIATVYGCEKALSILKLFSHDFNATNAASDLYALNRVKSAINGFKSKGISVKISFHTTDDNLKQYINYFKKSSDLMNDIDFKYPTDFLQKDEIFPAIFNKKQDQSIAEKNFKKLIDRINI